MNIKEKIIRLKKEKNAIILAHYYQTPDIQELADYVGDSLGLAQKAAETNAEIIVFAGVHFMAETAKILNPQKKVLLPDLNAGCSLADSCPPETFKKLLDQYPNHKVITYVNCSADIKALSDLVCTSSNAIKIVESIPSNEEIIFAPDKNLGKYIIHKTGREMILWDGACVVHEAFSLEKIKQLQIVNPDALLIAHPESQTEVLDKADYIGSTAGMISYVKNNPNNKYIVATEAGILYEMQKEIPEATLIPAPSYENNTCACSECEYMKLNTIQKLYDCLEQEYPKIEVEEKLRKKALLPLERMLELS